MHFLHKIVSARFLDTAIPSMPYKGLAIWHALLIAARMKKEEIQLDDLHRILVGNAPWEFLFEVFLRSLFIYVAFYIMVRWLGKRMNGQLTLTEMVVMLSFGAIIGLPMMSPDRGIVQGIVVIVCAFIFQRSISLWGFLNPTIEKWTQGRAKMLVKNGKLNLKEMSEARISHYQLFAKLRAKEIYQLGNVSRVYLEAEGLFSIYKNMEERCGLSTLPLEDTSLIERQQKETGKWACGNCGEVVDTSADTTNIPPCPYCKLANWLPAVK